MSQLQTNRLNSWKEIAGYLDRDVRTVSRWEKEKGLPVHRVPGGKRKAIYAFTGEIDNWLASANLENGDQTAGNHKQPLTLFQQQPRSIGVLSVFAAVIIVAALTAFLRLSRTPWEPAEVEFKNNEMFVRDKTGAIGWWYHFSRPLDRNVTAAASNSSRRTQIVDLDSRNGPEVIVVVGFSDSESRESHPADGLFCFSSGGKALWNLAADATFSFRDHDCGPPWISEDLLTFSNGSDRRIAWVSRHHMWWPGIVLLLDEKGQIVSKFVNSGWIMTLKTLENRGGTFLLAGGISNSNNSAMMAVLDAAKASGTSPEPAGSPYQCQNCPEGKPLRYLVFPRSELAPYLGFEPNRVSGIYVTKDGVEVRVRESHAENEFGRVEAIYEFSRDLRLLGASFSDAFAEVHRFLENEGRLKHSLQECPERSGPKAVRSWDPKNGWTELRLQRKAESPSRL